MTNKVEFISEIKQICQQIWKEIKRLFRRIFASVKPANKAGDTVEVTMLTIKVDAGSRAFFNLPHQQWMSDLQVSYFPANHDDARGIIEEQLGGLRWVPFANLVRCEISSNDLSDNSTYGEFMTKVLGHFPSGEQDMSKKTFRAVFTSEASVPNYPKHLPVPKARIEITYGKKRFPVPVAVEHYSDEQLAEFYPGCSIDDVKNNHIRS
jgi:hypothetical protein